jgi:hypothetical protein
MTGSITLLEPLFGEGDSDHPCWLLAVRIVILLLVAAAAALGVSTAARVRRAPPSRRDAALLVGVTVLAAVARFVVAQGNVLDTGGISFSRMLIGYKGHFAAAQLYSLAYQVAGREIDVAVWLNRLVGTATVPVAFALARRLPGGGPVAAVVAAVLLALAPAHVLFSASSELAPVTGFLCLGGYALLVTAAGGGAPRLHAALQLATGCLMLVLLTQLRWENWILLLPAAAWLVARRRAFDRRALLVTAGLAVGALAFLGLAALRVGPSPHGAVDYAAGLRSVAAGVAWSPLFAAPALFALALAGGRWRLALVAAVAWAAAVGVSALAAPHPHHSARVFASWLPLLIVVAALGVQALAERYRRGGTGALALVCIAAVAHCGLFVPRLRARYAETAELAAYRHLLDQVPAATRWLVVPDDEATRRSLGVTEELDRKYALTPRPRGLRAGLVGISALLDRPAAYQCGGTACVFFAGLPCATRQRDPLGAQCRALIAGGRTLARAPARAAPIECSTRPTLAPGPACAPRTVDLALVAVPAGVGQAAR